MKCVRFPLFLLLLIVSTFASLGFEQNGGGFTAAGLKGEYFPNATFAGAPAFTRQDVRIDFDWGEKAPIGGSNTLAYQNFPRGAFSIRWTGGVIPRYSEKYTFRIKGGPCQLWVGDRLVIDRQASSKVEAASEPVSMTMGKTESIKLEYARSEPGQAGVALEWSSASTPLALIDPVSVTGFNGESSNFSSDVLTSFFPLITAGGAQDGNSNTVRSGAPHFDKDGNPTGDFVTDPTYGTVNHPGTWLLQFSGQAQVQLQFGTPMTALDGTAYPNHIVPKADPHAYNVATNTTSILMAFKAGNYDYLFIGKTQRLASGAADATGNAAGLTNLKLIRPAAPYATTAYSGDNLFYGPEEPLVRRFTNLRWINGMLDESSSWPERLLPSAGHLSNTYTETGPGAGANSKYCWEYLVMLSNETGKDLYLTLPVVADDEYLTDLAHLIRFGSDGVKPYTAEDQWPVAGPVYPPLNSNLRVIFEMGNETWNGSGPYSQQRQAVDVAAKAAIAQGSADAVINYDGKAASDYELRDRRFLAHRLLVASNIFRSVFEPSNTTTQMTRIRPIFEYQYTNIASAQPAFDFIDDVYAKADPASPNKEAAHPVSYYFWGGGAATYFGSANEIGLQSEVALTDPDFETPDVAAGVAQDSPKGSAWNFVGNATGAAGIYHNSVRSKLAVASLGAASHEPRAVGCEFTVGAGDICVYQIGRYVKTPTTNDVRRDLHIYRVSDNAEVYSGQVSTRGATAGAYQYDYRNEPTILKAGTQYRLVSLEPDDATDYFDDSTTLNPPAGITIDQSISATFTDPNDKGNPARWTWVNGTAGNHCFGPVDVVYTTARNDNVGRFLPNAASGQQAAYVTGTGEIDQTFDVPSAGAYAFYFDCTEPVEETGNKLMFYVDGVNITPDAMNYVSSVPTTEGFYSSGGFDRNYPNRWGMVHFYTSLLEDAWCTQPFEIGVNGSSLNPGQHTLRIVGTTAGQHVFIDNIRVISAKAVLDVIPGTGSQNGAIAATNYVQSVTTGESFAQAFGLNAFAYEAGISLGGDRFGNPMHYYIKHKEKEILAKYLQWLDITSGAGVVTNTLGTYETWSDPATAETDPIVAAIDAYNNRLPAPPSTGVMLPNRLKTAEVTVDSGGRGTFAAPSAWTSWNVPVAKANSFTVAVDTTPGGSVRTLVDDHPIGVDATGAVHTYTLKLSEGLHVIRVQDAAGAFALNGVSVTVVNAPSAPELETATDGSSSVALSWKPATSGPQAKGYDVYLGTATGQNGTCLDVGNVTSFTVTGLQDKSPYFFVVRAYDDAGPSLPSNEKVGVPLSDGVVGSLLSWELEKNTGAEETVEPTSVTSRATASAISRGPGLRPSTYGPDYVSRGYGLSSKDSGPPFGATLADAIAAQQYVEFTFTPKPGKTFSLKNLAVRAFMQGSESASVGLTYSTDGSQFSSGLAATGGPPDAMTGNKFDLDLTDRKDLQEVTGKVTFRLYLYGPKIGQYGFNGLGKGPGNDIDLTGSFSSKP